MCLPSGETAGDPAPIWREMIRSASAACLLGTAGLFIVLTLVRAQRGIEVRFHHADCYRRHVSGQLRFAIAMPCFNEADGIESTLLELNAELSRQELVFLTFLQDDCSSDNSVEVISAAAQKCGAEIHISRNDFNSGHGPTSIRAYARAVESGADYVVFLDSDGQFVSKDVVRMINICMANPALEVCHGVRTHRVDGLIRKYVSLLLRVAIILRFRKITQDPNSPIRIYKSNSLSHLLALLPQNSGFPNIWLSIFAIERNLVVKYVKVRHRNRSGTSVVGSTWRASGSSSLNSFARLVKLCLRGTREMFQR